MTFPEFIKKRREELGYSSQDVGGRSGVSASFITGIERGVQFPSTATACDILTALNVEYTRLDPHSLQLDNGEVFRFKWSVRGRNKDNLPYKIEDRFVSLENRISSLETLLISLLAKTRKD